MYSDLKGLVGDFMTEFRLTAKQVTIVVLLAVLSISLVGRVTRAQEVRYRSIKAEPFRVHVDPVLFDALPEHF